MQPVRYRPFCNRLKLKKAAKEKNDNTRRVSSFEEGVIKVVSAFGEDEFPSSNADQGDQKDYLTVLSQIEKKVTEDMQNFHNVIQQLENEVQELENASKIQQQNENETVVKGNVNKLKQIRSKLTSLRNAREVDSKKSGKHKDEAMQKLKHIEDNIKDAWSTICQTKSSSTDKGDGDTRTDLVEMLSEMREKHATLEEEHDELTECVQLIKKKLQEVKCSLCAKPYQLDVLKGQGQSNNNWDKQVKDFREQPKAALVLVFEIDEILTENARGFSEKFMETKMVVANLKGLFHFVCQEDINAQTINQIKAKARRSEKQRAVQTNETEMDDVEAMILTFKQELAERGITMEAVTVLNKAITEREATIETIQKDHHERSYRQKEELKKYKDALEELDKEKQNLLTRLSKYAAANLTDNNPNIADLSDPKRPTKIAEEYSELYDNQWTNAFESLQDAGKSEDETVDFLRNIIQDVYSSCEEIGRNQNSVIRSTLLCPADSFMHGNSNDERKTNDQPQKPTTSNKSKGNSNDERKAKVQPQQAPASKKSKGKKETQSGVGLSAVHSKAISEMRKQLAEISANSVIRFFREGFQQWFISEALDTYTVRCIEICWWMNVQTPPVHLEEDVKPGSTFDKNKYKEYTVAGKKVAFLVWPALLLHEEGPLLTKGVAQGKK